MKDLNQYRQIKIGVVSGTQYKNMKKAESWADQNDYEIVGFALMDSYELITIRVYAHKDHKSALLDIVLNTSTNLVTEEKVIVKVAS